MAYVLDFTKVKKELFKVVLPDENKQVLSIRTPKKNEIRELQTMGTMLAAINPAADGGMTEEGMDALYGFAARLMSDNVQGITVDQATLETLLDFSDLILFFNGYTEFVTDQLKTNEKN